MSAHEGQAGESSLSVPDPHRAALPGEHTDEQQPERRAKPHSAAASHGGTLAQAGATATGPGAWQAQPPHCAKASVGPADRGGTCRATQPSSAFSELCVSPQGRSGPPCGAPDVGEGLMRAGCSSSSSSGLHHRVPACAHTHAGASYSIKKDASLRAILPRGPLSH